MREIKFRGKRIDNGEWVFGYFTTVDDKAFIQEQNPMRYPPDDEVVIETVGQYTGMKDNNGVEIYEGDIVKDGTGQINPIVFSNSTYWFNWSHLIDTIEPLTVIGNIHEQED